MAILFTVLLNSLLCLLVITAPIRHGSTHLLSSQHLETGDRKISQVQASLGYTEDPVSKRREEVRKKGQERKVEGKERKHGGAKIKELLLRVLSPKPSLL